jgi:cytochrome b561
MNNLTAASPGFFKETKPASIRIWHWLVFLFFTSSVVTVIFASTLFRTKDNIQMVQEQVQQGGGSITEKQARSVAHEYSDKLWMLHKYIGFGLSFLLLWRIIAELTIAKEKKLGSRIHKARSTPGTPTGKQHYLLVQYGYLAFYVLFILMALTGLVLAFEEVKWLDPIHDISKQIHSIVQWGLYGYAVLHISGTVIADAKQYNGIVSRMINGKDLQS